MTRLSFQELFPNGFNAGDYSDKSWVSNKDARSALRDELAGYGFKPPPFLVPNQINRFPDATDKAGEQTGWCWYTTIGNSDGRDIIIARFGSWRGNPELVKWCNKHSDYMSEAEITAMNNAMAEGAKIHAAEIAEKRAEAARRARDIVAASKRAPDDHPYLVNKKIGPHGLLIAPDKRLIVPIMNAANDVVSLQYIAEDGTKRFLPGGEIKGCFYKIEGSKKDGPVYIAEGFATAASVAELTHCAVYCAFNANNLQPVCEAVREIESGRQIIIAADNDHIKDHNTGLHEARKAVTACPGVIMVAPTFGKGDRGTDFNDMVASGRAVEAVAILAPEFAPKPKEAAKEKKKASVAAPEAAREGETALTRIADYYAATSGNEQPGFAMQTALAIGSFVCGRYFRTNENNFSALFFLNVGRTATGKEHCKTVIDNILTAAGLERQISGDGFTSAGAVMTTLLSKPRTISVIDEMGIYLEVSKAAGAAQMREGNATIMQAFGRCHSIMRPKNYSAMTLGKKAADDIKNREVYNPSLTLVGITTPSTLFESITSKDILSGFLNRFILSISDAAPDVRKRTTIIDVPTQIVRWIEAIQERVRANGNSVPMAEMQPQVETLDFSDQAYDIQKEFEAECVKKIIELEPRGLDGLPGRANEQAMRIALVHALARDPSAKIVHDIDMKFGAEYMRTALSTMIETVAKNVRYGKADEANNDILDIIENAGEAGVTIGEILAKPAGRKYDRREMQAALQTLVDCGKIICIQSVGRRGRPSIAYRALFD